MTLRRAAAEWVAGMTLVLGVALMLPASAGAQPTACAEAVEGWVAEAAEAIGVRAEAQSCPPGLARVRLFPEGAPPLDVEVAEPPGPAFRHAGRLRTSPIVEVNDYAELPEPQRRAYEALVAWLEDNEQRVTLQVPRGEVTRDGPAPTGMGLASVGWWLVLSALALLVIGAVRERPARAEWVTAAAVVLAAAALRAVFGVWGPHHVNGQGPLWVRGALEDPTLLAAYGPGYAELLGPVARLSPTAPDTAIFAANVVLSALCAGGVFAIARVAGLERNRALFAALLFACAPPSVRFAASEAYFAPIVALTVGATLAVTLAARELGRRQWLGAAVFVLAAGLLAAQATRLHPAAWIPVALVPLGALLAPGRAEASRSRDLLQRVVAAVAAAAVVAGMVWLASGAWVRAVLTTSVGADRTGTLSASLESLWHAPGIAVLLLVAASLVVARPRAPVLVGAAHVLAALATWRIYGQSTAWASSYVTMFVPMAAVGLGTVVPRDLRLPVAAALPAAMSLLVAWAASDALVEPTTEQLEHDFLRAELTRLDPDCRLAYLERADRRLVVPPTWAHAGGARPARVDDPGDVQTLTQRTCVYWLHTSICASAEAGPLCRDIERSLTLEPVAHTRLPARPSYDGLPYDAERVEIAIHRVVPRP